MGSKKQKVMSGCFNKSSIWLDDEVLELALTLQLIRLSSWTEYPLQWKIHQKVEIIERNNMRIKSKQTHLFASHYPNFFKDFSIEKA